MEYFTSSDGIRLAYQDHGTGFPVICLAGLTRNSSDFDFVAPHLTDIRLIRPDYRGRGASDRADYGTYTIPQEAQDVLTLMDHLGLARAAFLGTSRGGLISMALAAGAKDRVLGVCLNDIGPVIEQSGLDGIMDYIGRNPSAESYDQAAQDRPAYMVGFANVPAERWQHEVRNLFEDTGDGLVIRYDAKLRDAMVEASQQPPADLWPLFDAMAGLPLALVHGANSDLLSDDTAAEMRRRRPDMLYANVKDRGHVPFLDEPESLNVIRPWLEAMK